MIDEALPIASALCVRFEGVYLRPYLCPTGKPTLGVGATFYEDGRRVTLADAPITRDRAMELLHYHLSSVFMPGVLRLCPTIDTAGRLAAITDFALNLGLGNLSASTLRKRILAQQWDDVPAQLLRWRYGGGRELRGLVLRREAEAALI
jgi:lysozyme